jgi:outer membrane protein assembly factor BamB
MAHIFALLLAVLLQAKPPVAPAIALDARWATAFVAPPAATPGFDATTAYVPLKSITNDAGLVLPAELVAVDLDRGTIRWRLNVATVFTPATGDGLVFTTNDEFIEAREALTGTTKWRVPLPGGAAAPLYFDTGWLIASTPAGDLAALRASDGVIVWRRQLGAPLVGPPGPALDRLFLPLADNRLVAVMLATGDTVWERTMNAPITGLLALEDQVIFGTAAKDLVSVDLKRGRERWTWQLGGDLAGIPSADEKRIYFASRDNLLRAIDRSSGNLKWKVDLGSRPAGGPLTQVLTDALLMPLVSSQIVGFDAVTGKPSVTATAAGEIGLQPYVRRDAGLTQTRLITVSREGQLQGFGRRYEPVPLPLAELVGLPTVP